MNWARAVKKVEAELMRPRYSPRIPEETAVKEMKG